MSRRGIVKAPAGPGLEFRTDLPIPEINDDEVLLKIRCASICGRRIWETWDDFTTVMKDPIYDMAALSAASSRSRILSRASPKCAAAPPGRCFYTRETRQTVGALHEAPAGIEKRKKVQRIRLILRFSEPFCGYAGHS